MVDRVGQQLGNYRISQVLGHGGFADVYLGEHIYLKTPAAIKILQTRLSGEDVLESFLKEARIIAGLTHPNIVRVLDFGVDNEIPFLVMDYAPKGTLRQRHPRGTPLPLPTIISYVKQLADALQYAHDEKFIHRDIKPENMLIGKRNEILLSDFGIALVAQSSRNQSVQDVTGTVAYMAPEQIQGKPRPASDQYSLGIVVYEWLSGTPPFKGSFTELCTQHMFASPPPLREKVPAIPLSVEQVVMTALAKEPKQRFGSMRAFVNALEQASTSDQPATPNIQPTPLPQPRVKQEVVLPTVPVQLADNAPLPEVHPYNTGDSAQGRPVTQPPQETPVTVQIPKKKVNTWAIGRQQIIAMLIGTIIFGVVSYLLDLLLLKGSSSSLFSSIGGLPYLPSWYSLLIGLSIAIPLCFGARSGPWVALLTFIVGSLIADSISGYLTSGSAVWYLYAASALFSFIASFAFYRSKGQYGVKGAMRTALMISSIGWILGSILYAAGDSFVSHINFFYALLFTLLSYAPGLILLIIYARITSRTKNA